MERTDLKKALKGQKISELDKASIELLRAEINEKLSVIESTYGVSIKLSRIRYGDISFKASLEAKLLSPDSRLGPSVDEIEFRRLCWKAGLRPEHYNKQVKLSGKLANMTGRIVRINTRAKRYPVIVQLDDGRMAKMSGPGAREQLI